MPLRKWEGGCRIPAYFYLSRLAGLRNGLIKVRLSLMHVRLTLGKLRIALGKLRLARGKLSLARWELSLDCFEPCLDGFGPSRGRCAAGLRPHGLPSSPRARGKPDCPGRPNAGRESRNGGAGWHDFGVIENNRCAYRLVRLPCRGDRREVPRPGKSRQIGGSEGRLTGGR